MVKDVQDVKKMFFHEASHQNTPVTQHVRQVTLVPAGANTQGLIREEEWISLILRCGLLGLAINSHYVYAVHSRDE